MSWVAAAVESHFSLANIPFGIVSKTPAGERHAAIAIHDHVLDLHEFAAHNGFDGLPEISSEHIATFSLPTLNAFAALGQDLHRKVREYLQEVLANSTRLGTTLRDNVEASRASLIPMEDVTLHLPMHIGGYTDFFAGRNHAYNCGCIFRDPAKALQPNYLHLPVGYNSRASTVVVSGTDIRRPLGQRLSSTHPSKSDFGPCQRLDMELELGAFLCKGNDLGDPIDVNRADEYIFGYVLLNDWSARDIQAWEAVPLGPFNAKTFASTISPWVVLKDALEPFRVPSMPNEVELHPYLRERERRNVYDIALEAQLTTRDGHTATLSRTNGRQLVFSFPQMLAHHTIGGCRMEVGDLLGSGTISGTDRGSLGSLLEMSNGGKTSVALSPQVQRTFLEDGDTVTITGCCGTSDTGLVGFGPCKGLIVPCPSLDWIQNGSDRV